MTQLSTRCRIACDHRTFDRRGAACDAVGGELVPGDAAVPGADISPQASPTLRNV